MKKLSLLSISVLLLLSGTLSAQYRDQYTNPTWPDYRNNDSRNHHNLVSKSPEYQVLNINMLSSVEEPIDISLHLGNHEATDTNRFIFSEDGTEKLVVHIAPFFSDTLPYSFTENYHVDCVQSTSEGETTLYGDSGNEVSDQGADNDTGYPLITSVGGHFKLNGYDTDVTGIPMMGPEGNMSVQNVIRSSFYQIWPISEGTETLTFSVKKMTKLKKGFATFKEIRRFDVRIHALPPFVPAGSDDQDQLSKHRGSYGRSL
ncbi:MAG: hypothetical protein K2W99_08540 [Chthoniobacterales bacterium]|nr:hypothetical protein [Chthoniobacterales bacterium]